MIGTNLASLRAARGLSQGELADQVGVAQQTIAKIEKGSRPLRYVEAILICGVLKVPIAALAAQDVASSAALLALTTNVWTISKSIDESAKRLAEALVQLGHEVAAIRSGVHDQPAQFEYDRAVGYLETDWGRNLNESLTEAVRLDKLLAHVEGIDGPTYREILSNLSDLKVTLYQPGETNDSDS